MYSVEMYQRVRRACHVEGMSIRQAAKLFGLHRKTISFAAAWTFGATDRYLANDMAEIMAEYISKAVQQN
jgi:hypothetical protein